MCKFYIFVEFIFDIDSCFFLLGFTCMFVSLQCFLQHLVQETIWKFFLWKTFGSWLKQRWVLRSLFPRRVKVPSWWFNVSYFISILWKKNFLLSVCIAVAWRIPPILSWDQSLHKQYVDKFAFAYLNCILPCVFLLPSKQQWKMSIVLLVELP